MSLPRGPRPLPSTSLWSPLVLLAAGCAAAGPAGSVRSAGSISVETSNFPTREAVARIAAAPVPARLLDDRGKDVPSWELDGPLPDALDGAPSQDDSPWGKLLAESAAVKSGDVVPTEAMRCVARQYAAFYLANQTIPADALQRFIAARCGAPTGQIGAAAQAVTGDDRIPEEKLYEQFHERVKGMIEKTVQPGHLDAGVGYLRKNGHAVIAVAITPRTVRLLRTPFVPGPDGKVVLRGELLAPAATLRAMVNRGRYGYATCAVDPTVRLPSFAVTCDPAREDEVAWLTVSSLPPGRLLGIPVVDLLVWPSGAPGKSYVKLGRTPSAAPPAAVASLPELVEEINRVRKDAGLTPVSLAEKESQTATQLAPHYFAGMTNPEDTAADQVALGLLAGWDVEGMVRNGHFVSTMLQGGGYRDLIQAALARPLGRETLLDPAIERVSIGTLASGDLLGLLLSSYTLFDGYHHDGDSRAVAARLTALRRERGMKAPSLTTELNNAAERAAGSVQAGRRSPEEALQELVRFVTTDLGRSASAWAAETGALDQMKIPDALLASPALIMGLGVAHHRRPGHAWGRFIVYFVAVETPSSVMTAARDGAHAG